MIAFNISNNFTSQWINLMQNTMATNATISTTISTADVAKSKKDFLQRITFHCPTPSLTIFCTSPHTIPSSPSYTHTASSHHSTLYVQLACQVPVQPSAHPSVEPKTACKSQPERKCSIKRWNYLHANSGLYSGGGASGVRGPWVCCKSAWRCSSNTDVKPFFHPNVLLFSSSVCFLW